MEGHPPVSGASDVYLGLGSNLGDRMGNLRLAVERLSEKVTVKGLSSAYETAPVGYEEQPAFLNAALSGTTELEPLGLLEYVKRIEDDLGRRPSFRNAPRPIDIDILFYGDRVIHTAELTIPHPRVAERAFVLVPLAEIAPDLVHPVSRKRVADLLAGVDGLDGVVMMGALSREGAV